MRIDRAVKSILRIGPNDIHQLLARVNPAG